MPTFSHKQIAVFLSVISAVLSIATAYVLLSVTVYFPLFYLLLVGLIVFIVMYVLTFYIVRSFILKKVHPLYAIIHASSDSLLKKAVSEDVDDYNIISATEKNVQNWLKNQESKLTELEQREQFRKEYIGNVSHELKTPLFAIQGYIATLLDGAIHDEKVHTKYLEYAEKSTQRMIAVVQDLEEISKLESGQINPDYTIFNCVTLVQEVFETHKHLAEQKLVSLKLELSDIDKIEVCADRKYIFTVFSNLILNGILYNKSKQASVIIRFFDMDTKILVEIADTGIGIPKQDLDRIFERFYRVDKARSRNHGGTGLGLAIVKHIIEGHNQNIYVKSTLHKGTSFSFTLDKAVK